MNRNTFIALVAVLFIFVIIHLVDESSSTNAENPNVFSEQAISERTLIVNDRVQANIWIDDQSINAPSTDVITDKNSMQYEDDWCIAIADLNSESITYAMRENEEWQLKQNNIFLDHKTRPFEQVGNGLLMPYKELDVKVLEQLAENNDILALLTLLQRDDLALITKKEKYARHLVVLGDLNQGLSALVSNLLTKAKVEYGESQKIDENVKGHLLNVLSLVEYGLQNKSAAALDTYVFLLSTMNDFDPSLILSPKDLHSVPENTKHLLNIINVKRESLRLPSIEQNINDLPKIALRNFEREIVFLKLEFMDQMLGPAGAMTLWGENYLANNLCQKRMMTFYASFFRNE